MTDRDAILAAIVANPDDTTARLVFADWLDETGNERDAAHAELIRVQCELSSQRRGAIAASEENDRVQDALESRERELLTNNIELVRPIAELFVEPNPCPLVHYGHSGCYDPTAIGKAIGWEWRNGFVETIRMPIAMFVIGPCAGCNGSGRQRNWYQGFNYECSRCNGKKRTDGVAAALVSRCPIRRVEFTDRSPAVFGNGHGNWSTGTESRFPYSIPQALFDLLQGQHTKRHGFLRASYDTVDLAIDALSRAAIAYARKRAGLPEWVPQTEGG